MNSRDHPIAVGDPLPDVWLQTADGGAWSLSSLRGRPVVLVCVRYYG